MIIEPRVILAVYAPALVASMLLYIWRQLRFDLPTELPRVRSKSRHDSRSMQAWLSENYKQFTKKGRSYIIPNFSREPFIVVPISQFSWFSDRKDNATSNELALLDDIAAQYSLPSTEPGRSRYSAATVQRYIIPRLAELVAPTWDEITYQTDREFGNGGEVKLWGVMARILEAVACRVLIGQEMCRDENFMNALLAFNRGVEHCIVCTAWIPRILRPVLCPILLRLPQMRRWKTLEKALLHPVKGRLAKAAAGNEKLPEDFFTWHLRDVQAGRLPPAALEPLQFAQYFIPVEFGATSGPSTILISFFLDILSTDPADNVIGVLREEVERVFADENGVWTKQGLARLYRLESAIRESMRVSPFEMHGVFRKVTAPEGLYNPVEGYTAPKGSLIGLDMWALHHDPDIYTNPKVFDPLRFSRAREAMVARGEKENGVKALGLTYVGNEFLGFGTGKHTCPGRFYIDQTFKMMIAYILMNYDMEYLSERPRSVWYADFAVPPLGAAIRVKRRANATSAQD